MGRPIPPGQLGMPSKFKEWQPGQWEAIERAVHHLQDSGAFLLEAPPGCGKTVIGMAVASILQKNLEVERRLGNPSSWHAQTIFLVKTKQLQDQILQDFPYAATIKGRSNYKCAKYPKLFPQITAADCTDRGSPCSKKNQCSYRIAKYNALLSKVAVINTYYYLAESKYVGFFTKGNLLIVDEVDAIEADVTSFSTKEITEKRLFGKIGGRLPFNTDNLVEWTEWAKSKWGDMLMQATKAENKLLNSIVEPDPRALKRIRAAINLAHDLKEIAFKVNPSNWLLEITEDKECIWKFRPVLANGLGWETLWRYNNQIMGMSGTILDAAQIASDIGFMGRKNDQGPQEPRSQLEVEEVRERIEPVAAGSWTLPCSQPAEQRPIYYSPAANITRRSMDAELPKLLDAVQRLIGHYQGKKVLIHTVSYVLRDYLVDHLSGSGILSHDLLDREEKLEQFRRSEKARVMISPSFDRGVDLPEDQCRCVIICKVPYPNLGDKRVARRIEMASGREWYLAQSVRTLIQMSMRGNRSPKDRCDTWILDKQFARLWKEAHKLIPSWWRDALANSPPTD